MSIVRFRIKPECLDAALGDFRAAGAEPSRIIDRENGEVAVEFDSLTDEQGAAIAATFHPEYSTIIGFIGGSPFENGH